MATSQSTQSPEPRHIGSVWESIWSRRPCMLLKLSTCQREFNIYTPTSSCWDSMQSSHGTSSLPGLLTTHPGVTFAGLLHPFVGIFWPLRLGDAAWKCLLEPLLCFCPQNLCSSSDCYHLFLCCFLEFFHNFPILAYSSQSKLLIIPR